MQTSLGASIKIKPILQQQADGGFAREILGWSGFDAYGFGIGVFLGCDARSPGV